MAKVPAVLPKSKAVNLTQLRSTLYATRLSIPRCIKEA
jgi:hypothetical protein